ncbi:hypothetical protein NM688_g2264 [Phlebia brevispora]|uniref:Uncharacterized protein n=1 Tax=Phlebia brevispora TaxID=194682 RepID=A0ACC1T984_9APHY|nr:hypothetical protein NM688_g2264 [Phlebia brevispora]
MSATPRGIRLKDQVCIVTGAGSQRGIGWATVMKFAHEGARHIYVMDIATGELPGLVATLHERYLDVKVAIVEADATDEDAIKSVCERALEETGRLDVVFANAGGGKGGFSTLVKDMSVDDFMGTLKLNVLSCFLAAKYAPQAMSKFAAFIPRQDLYIVNTCSKAAIISVARNAAEENLILRNGVRVNAVCPGIVRTGLTDLLIPTGNDSASNPTPGAIVRIGLAEGRSILVLPEIANVVCFLASTESSYVIGQSYVVDGGLTAPLPMGKLQTNGP